VVAAPDGACEPESADGVPAGARLRRFRPFGDGLAPSRRNFSEYLIIHDLRYVSSAKCRQISNRELNSAHYTGTGRPMESRSARCQSRFPG
jgi:hypothetical protein